MFGQKLLIVKTLLGFLILLLGAGCQPAVEPPVVGATPLASTASTASTVAPASPGAPVAVGKSLSGIPGLPAAVTLELGAGGAISASDGSWSTRSEGNKVVVLEGGSAVATIVHKEAERWDVMSPDGQRVMKVKFRSDGDYKVEDASEKMLVKLKKRDDGYKAVDSDEETVLVKVAAKDGKVKVKDGSERELAKLDGGDALTLCWLYTAKLPLSMRLGMATSTWSRQ